MKYYSVEFHNETMGKPIHFYVLHLGLHHIFSIVTNRMFFLDLSIIAKNHVVEMWDVVMCHV